MAPIQAIPVVNALAAYLPHVLALTAPSPHWSGYDMGPASNRAVIVGGSPASEGAPQPFADWSEFEEYMDTLLRGEFAGDRHVLPGEAAHGRT